MIEQLGQLLGLVHVHLLRHTESEEMHRGVAVGYRVVDLLHRASLDLDVRQILAPEIEKHLPPYLDLQRMHLLVDQHEGAHFAGRVGATKLQDLPSADEEQLRLVAEEAADGVRGDVTAFAKQLSSSCACLLLDLPLLLLVPQPALVVFRHARHPTRQTRVRIGADGDRGLRGFSLLQHLGDGAILRFGQRGRSKILEVWQAMIENVGDLR